MTTRVTLRRWRFRSLSESNTKHGGTSALRRRPNEDPYPKRPNRGLLHTKIESERGKGERHEVDETHISKKQTFIAWENGFVQLQAKLCCCNDAAQLVFNI